jgi:hypothetical protein
MSIRLWFCLAVAAIGAAIADIMVERASNAGLFGAGNFTDHSNLDIVPMLVIGVVFVAGHLVLRVRKALGLSDGPNLLDASRAALSGRVARLLPAIFCLQIAMLYAMETAEQLVVAGHAFGGTIWLGGPALISLCAHVLVSAFVAISLAALLRVVTRKAVQAICSIRAMAVRPVRGIAPIELGRVAPCLAFARTFVLRNIAERAPPFLTA